MKAKKAQSVPNIPSSEPVGTHQGAARSQALNKGKLIIFLCSLLLASALLFAQLGHYAIWDDEAMIALVAKGVLKTGDTSVQPDDHNLVAYRNGLLVRDLKDRSTPPLSAYLTAASFAVFGQTSFAARLPFALFGLATVALVLYWAQKAASAAPLVETAPKGKGGKKGGSKLAAGSGYPWLVPLLVALGVLGNVSLILYCRQCRYYAPTAFLSVAVVFLYLHWRGGQRSLLAIAGLSVVLFASNYLNYFALYLCILGDYAIWRRKERPLAPSDWAALLGPQIVLCGALFMVWNPLRTAFGGYVEHNSLGQKLTLLFWQVRDLNRCEFVSGGLILLALGLMLSRKDQWLMRGLLALGLYVCAITAVSPQTVKLTSVADVRYLMPVIPLGIALGVRAIYLVAGKNAGWAIGFAAVAFGTNLLNGGPLLWNGARSTIADYVGELTHPPTEPYTPAAKWINENVKEGESVWVLPDYMPYSLMFHAPKAVYAWQLSPDNRSPQFMGLPAIHFQGRTPPDYILAFGPVVQQVQQMIAGWQGVHYERAGMIDCFWKDMFRPELFWRTFKPMTGYNKSAEAIYVFKKS